MITRLNAKTCPILCDGEQWRVSPALLRKIIDLSPLTKLPRRQVGSAGKVDDRLAFTFTLEISCRKHFALGFPANLSEK
ncbi:hypothetical protein [Noviherbaspirillum pedocola]|uniref:Uncharacterized protein n=1 Tax=Noviherbaspirillum pedocola TaxID=2801341 RepID=A0A934SWZ6_9BURK|nr:hypothetical protein [Noviherbaspirillum pedocola]MBK4737302.1 hypothetical protein [Noviherbaspirillum pedocola]